LAAALTSGRRSLQVPPPAVRRAQQLRVRAETEAEKAAAAAEELELDNPESESARKKAEADRLRAAEKFMVIGTGEATCKNCGYEYTPTKGDPEYPISKGTQFQQLPDDWQCPTCGAEKRVFVTKQRQVGSRRCPSFTRLHKGALDPAASSSALASTWFCITSHAPCSAVPLLTCCTVSLPRCCADLLYSVTTPLLLQVAGFAENQGYGLGTNSMDENQKSLLIFGGLAFFFVLLLAGYALP
jgi:rubredoxin